MSDADFLYPTHADARPPLGFRVGVTAHINLPSADTENLTAAIGEVLDTIAATLAGALRTPAGQRLYKGNAPLLRLISPLAAGGDRLVAKAALDRNWRLAAPLPFPQAEYERDFPKSIDEFRTLLSAAQATGEVVEIDGTRTNANQAYEEVGRFVLRHADVIVAIWDGEPPNGQGGTAQIVAEARALGIPVVHIASVAPHGIRLLRGDLSFNRFTHPRLAAIVRAAALPHWPKGQRNHTHAAQELLTREICHPVDKDPDFLYCGPFSRRRGWFSRIYPGLVSLLAKPSLPSTTSKQNPPAPQAGNSAAILALYLHFQRADALATHYADTHRSAYVLIYLFGSLSLVSAFTAQFLHDQGLGWPFTFLELGLIVFIGALVKADHCFRWRERWLDYRLLAEQLRQADLLARIGGGLSTGSLDRLNETHPARGWVLWLVMAVTRAAGLAGARYDMAYLEQLRDYATEVRLADQISYHQRTAVRNADVNRCLKGTSQILFLVTIVAIVAEFVFWKMHWDSSFPPWLAGFFLAWLAGVLPAFAAASFGIRNQAEFEIVVDRSSRLRERLEVQQKRIARLKGALLTSTVLREAIKEAAQIMQTDAAEWAAIFEVKESEVV